jgi:hypothetical protein
MIKELGICLEDLKEIFFRKIYHYYENDFEKFYYIQLAYEILIPKYTIYDAIEKYNNNFGGD